MSFVRLVTSTTKNLMRRGNRGVMRFSSCRRRDLNLFNVPSPMKRHHQVFKLRLPSIAKCDGFFFCRRRELADRFDIGQNAREKPQVSPPDRTQFNSRAKSAAGGFWSVTSTDTAQFNSVALSFAKCDGIFFCRRRGPVQRERRLRLSRSVTSAFVQLHKHTARFIAIVPEKSEKIAFFHK